MDNVPVNNEPPPSQISFGIRQFVMRLATIVMTAVVILMVIRYVIL